MLQKSAINRSKQNKNKKLKSNKIETCSTAKNNTDINIPVLVCWNQRQNFRNQRQKTEVSVEIKGCSNLKIEITHKDIWTRQPSSGAGEQQAEQNQINGESIPVRSRTEPSDRRQPSSGEGEQQPSRIAAELRKRGSWFSFLIFVFERKRESRAVSILRLRKRGRNLFDFEIEKERQYRLLRPLP